MRCRGRGRGADSFMERFSYTAAMEQAFAPTRLDLKALAISGEDIAGLDVLSHYPRLADDLRGDAPDGAVHWVVRAEWRPNAAGVPEVWMKVRLSTALPLVCQRCLGPVEVLVVSDRWFRFVASEEVAEAQDDDVEEDVLVLRREFNLAELIEDELLLEWPVIPRHEVCPTPVRLAVADADFESPDEAKPNPFAMLKKLQDGKSS